MEEPCKGRDWYDLIWFVSQKIPVNLNHLKVRIMQSEDYDVSYHSSDEIRKEMKKQSMK